jgi:hypothetical protein
LNNEAFFAWNSPRFATTSVPAAKRTVLLERRKIGRTTHGSPDTFRTQIVCAGE